MSRWTIECAKFAITISDTYTSNFSLTEIVLLTLCYDNGFNVITMSDLGYDLNSQSILVQDENR